jgi:hypothetical protein
MRDFPNRYGRTRALPVIMLALFATLVAVGCAKGPDDSVIKSDIQSRFYADPGLKATNLQVVVTKGQVMLTGEVPSNDLKDRAVLIAKGTTGVKDVEAAATPAPAPAEAQPAPAPAPRRAAPRRAARPAAPEPAPAPVEQAAPPAAAAQPQAPAARQEPVRLTIPAGRHLSVQMIDAVDSSKDKAGQVFQASLNAPIVVDGEQVVPVGANVYVRLAVAKSAGKMTGASELELQLVRMETGGRSYPLVSNSYTVKGKSRGKQTATRVGAGAAIGAVVGAIAGGGKGAAIGAAAGAGAGTAVQLATRGQQVKVPSETVLDFELQQAVTVVQPPA